MTDSTTNKSGNKRGLSPKSKAALKKANAERTPKKQKENATKAGIASGKVRAVLKDFKEELKEVVEEENPQDKTGNKYTALKALAKMLYKKALQGDLKALELLLKILDMLPKDKLEITNTTPQIVVASQADANLIKEIQDVKPN